MAYPGSRELAAAAAGLAALRAEPAQAPAALGHFKVATTGTAKRSAQSSVARLVGRLASWDEFWSKLGEQFM